MKTQNFKSRSLVGASIAVIGLAMVSTPAFAQAASEEATSDTAIIVTGSRIARPNVESASPITTVSPEDIKSSGATKIEDLTNQLPQVFAGQTSGRSNGADGTATIDLRGLGASRTLVLIDGRRLMPGNLGGTSGADLNFIPGALVSGVELVTGGASATYGADAVAGVVNFKMNRKFEGLRLDAQYGFYQHNNNNGVARGVVNSRFVAPEGNTVVGGAFEVSGAIGAGFDDNRGNVVAYAGYRKESAITQDSYDYSICALGGAAAGTNYTCGGSGTPAVTRLGGFSAANRTLAGLPAAGSYTITGTGARPFVASDQYNFAPLNYFRRPSSRFTAGAFAEYEISDAIKPYMDVMFMDYGTNAQIAPSGAFFAARAVNCNNPLLLRNAQVATAACGANVGVDTNTTILIAKRNVEGGPRYNDIGFNQLRIVSGVKGDISSDWSYDVSGQIGKIKLANVYRNDVSEARILKGLQVVNVGGVPTCKSVVDESDLACVPYDVFNVNGVTQAAANYIGIPLVLTGTVKEVVALGTISGDLGGMGFTSPLADEGVMVSFGAEYRKESLESQPDLAYIQGDGAGQGGPLLPLKGSYSVRDVFAEAVVPLVTDKPFFEDLALEAGFRHSTYSVPGAASNNSANTWKLLGSWKPIEDIKFRASRQRAVRSPNIGELFSNQSVGLFGGSDPCAGAAVGGLVNGNTAAQCARTGVTAAQFGNILENLADQYNQFGGGNPNVNPEKADSWSVGAVLTPTFLKGFSFSVDYFNIRVKDPIGSVGAQTTLDECIKTGNPFFCSNIKRSTATATAGSLWLDKTGYVIDTLTNTGGIKTSGFDFNGDYRTSVGEHKLTWKFNGTYLRNYKSLPYTGGDEYDCAGLYGARCGTPNPTFRFITNLKWTLPSNIGMTVRWRYFSSVKHSSEGSDPVLRDPNTVILLDRKLPSVSFIDMQFELPIKDTATMRVGVNNVFDKDPPFVAGASGGVNGNTFPGTYDHLGRNIFVSLTADF